MLTGFQITPSGLKVLSDWTLDYAADFAVAVCIGLLPGTEQDHTETYETYTEQILAKLRLFDAIGARFEERRLGREVQRDTECMLLLCRFPLWEKEAYAQKYLRPLLTELERELHVSFLAGAGIPAANEKHLEKSLSTAKEAFELFFFEERPFLEFQKNRRQYRISFEEYEILSEQAFKSILMRAPEAIATIDQCIDLIRRIHYGNKGAVIMRAMNFTGEMAYRLHRYNLIDADFYPLQDALQEKVLDSRTFTEVKQHIHAYYDSLLEDIFRKSPSGRKTAVEQAKAYMRENYMEPLTVEEMAKLACVSSGYFRQIFKQETGQTFKQHLIEIRMNVALELLLGSDLRLYEISEKVGYRNVRNFEEAFYKKYGSYPGSYKKQLLGG